MKVERVCVRCGSTIIEEVEEWDRHCVPPVCWVRHRGQDNARAIIEVDDNGISFVGCRKRPDSHRYGMWFHLSWVRLTKNMQFSVDLHNWYPITKDGLKAMQFRDSKD